jgi:DNA-directed RNA polymerase specialized sigma24 family protein
LKRLISREWEENVAMTSPDLPDQTSESDADRGVELGPWSDPATLYPIATDDAFSNFYVATLTRITRYVRAKYCGIAPDESTAEQIVSDAYEALYQKKETVERAPLAKLEDEIINVIRRQERRRMVSLDGPGFSDDVIPAESGSRSVASEVAGLELRAIFSDEAVGCLTKAERLLYDLVADGMPLTEIAKRSGISYHRTKEDWNKVFSKLCVVMRRNATHLGDGKREPPRTRKAAIRAIEELPVLLRHVVRLFHVENIPPAQIVHRLGLASTDELRVHQERAYEVLEHAYGEKMPEALDAALGHVHGNAGKKGSDRSKPGCDAAGSRDSI